MTEEGRSRIGLRGVLALFALLAAVHAVLLPLFEGPDEPDNLTYIRFLVEEGRLTRPTVTPSHELEQLGRGHMPPLWFLSMVPVFDALGATDWEITAPRNPGFFRRQSVETTEEVAEVLDRPGSRLNYRHGVDESNPFRGAGFAVRAMRWLSIPWALVALVATWLIAARLTGSRGRATWFTALGATLPQLEHLSGTITMDLMLAAWGGLALYACVEWCGGETGASRWAALAGLGTALASLTKLNGLVLVPACGLAAVFAWRAGRGFLRPLLVCALAFALVAGPYYLWGWIESGHPLWSLRYQEVSPFHTGNLPEATTWDVQGFTVFALSLFVTWFADFGWTAVWFPTWVVAPFGLLTALGVAGAVVMAFGPRGAARWIGLWLAALVVIGSTWLVLAWIVLGRERLGATEGESTAAVAISGAVLLVAAVLGAAGALRRHRIRKVAGVDSLPPGSPALGFLLASAALILAAELWFNLKFAQPQARHLYPFLPALIVPVAAGLERLRLLRVVVIVQLALSIAAIPWLLGRLRTDGWNESPIWAATDVERRADPSLTEDRSELAAVDWVEPENRASFGPDSPPTLVWRVDGESFYDVAVGLRPELENRPWRLDGVVFRALAVLEEPPRGSLEIPANLWSTLVPGTSLYVQVIAIGPDGRATGRSTVRELRRAE